MKTFTDMIRISRDAMSDEKENKRQCDPIDAIVGANIRRMRVIRHLSQEKLGEKMGLTFQQIQKYEKGSNRCGASRLVKLAKILKVNPSTLFEGTGTFNEQPIADEFLRSLTPEDEKILYAYRAISSPRQRAAILQIMRTMAQANADDDK